MKSYSIERTGWRDSGLSQRHRYWGFNCPAVDLDFVMVEYNHGSPVALVEYKHKNAAQLDTSHPTYKALVALADGYSKGPLPCFIARYDPEVWTFSVIPLNETCRKIYGCGNMTMSERLFVRSLYMMRKSVLNAADENALSQLNDDVTVQGRDSPACALFSNN